LCIVLLRGIAMFPQNIAFPVLCDCVVANTIWLGSFKEQIHMKRENRSEAERGEHRIEATDEYDQRKLLANLILILLVAFIPSSPLSFRPIFRDRPPLWQKM